MITKNTTQKLNAFSSRLREENRRLLQERGENQQVIQLLEMQKNILSKTVGYYDTLKYIVSIRHICTVVEINIRKSEHG